MGELWDLLVEADEAEDGIPKSLVDKKMADMKKDGIGEAKIVKEEAQSDWNKRLALSNFKIMCILMYIIHSKRHFVSSLLLFFQS